MQLSQFIHEYRILAHIEKGYGMEQGKKLDEAIDEEPEKEERKRLVRLGIRIRQRQWNKEEGERRKKRKED